MSDVAPAMIQTAPYAVTFDEFFCGYRPYSTKMTRIAIVRAAVTWGILLAAGSWLSGGYLLRSWLLWVFLGLMVLVILQMPAQMRAEFRKIYDDRFGNETVRTTLDEYAVAVSSATTYTVIRWAGFTHYLVRAEWLILYRTERIPILLPRRAFRTDAEFDAAMKMVERYVGYSTPQRGFEAVPVADFAGPPTPRS